MINKIKISEFKRLAFDILIQEVDLEDSFTLKHIFVLMYCSGQEIQTFFKSFLNIPYLDLLKDELFSIPSQDESDQSLENPEVFFEKLLIKKHVYFSKTNKYPGYSNEYFSLTGISKNKEDKNTYALDFMELNKIANTPVVFSKEVEFEKNGFDSPKYFEFLELKNTEYNLTILDLIKSIIFELTFYGSPSLRDELKKDLLLRIDEIKLGTVKTYTLNEVDDLFAKNITEGEE